jgi:hypothetical protein
VAKEEIDTELINKIMVRFTALFATLMFSSFGNYRKKMSEFHSKYLYLLLETKRLDDYLDEGPGKLKDRLAYFNKEVFRILKEEKVPAKLHPRIKQFADGVCHDFRALHTGKTSGPMDILRKKADNATRLVLLTTVAKTFPEVSLKSRRLIFMLKMGILYSRVMGFADDFVDVAQDKKTPHLNSFLTAIRYGR